MGNNEIRHTFRKTLLQVHSFEEEKLGLQKEISRLKEENLLLKNSNYIVSSSAETFFSPTPIISSSSSSSSYFTNDELLKKNQELEALIESLQNTIGEKDSKLKTLKKDKKKLSRKANYHKLKSDQKDDISSDESLNERSEEDNYPNVCQYFEKIKITDEDILDRETMSYLDNILAEQVISKQFKKKTIATKINFLTKLNTQILMLSPEVEAARCPAAYMERQRLKGYFDDAYLTYLSDTQKVSLSTLNVIRQLQKKDYNALGKESMLFASTFRIKRFRKAMAIAGDALLNPKILPNKTFWQMDLGKTLEQFIRRRYQPSKINSSQIVTVELCFTYDGTRWGSKSLVLGGFKVLGTQSREDCFVTTIFVGKDNAANSYTYFGSLFRFAEFMNEEIIEVDGKSFKLKITIPADMKAHWGIYGCGHGGNCHLCQKKNQDFLRKQ